MRARPGRVTIYDVAERAGVSISTVSLAVSAPHRVRPETRQRIVAAATALGYRMTQGRRVGAARIAVAAPFTTYPSYLRRLSGMLRRARDAAVDIIPYDLDSAAAADEPLLDVLPTRTDATGLVVMGVPLGGAARRASRAARIPVVYVDVVPTRRTWTVRSSSSTIATVVRRSGATSPSSGIAASSSCTSRSARRPTCRRGCSVSRG